MSSIGFPDGQRITQWLGAPIAEASAFAIGAGALALGPFSLASWASVIVACKPTGGALDVTVTQNISGGPAGLQLTETFHVAAGATLFEAIVLFGDAVTVTFQGAAVGETLDYAIYPSNTTTNANVITQATINVQANEVLVAAEPTLDFVIAGGNSGTVVDDGPNTRVKVGLPKITTSTLAAGPPAAPQDGDYWIATNADGAGGRWMFQYDAAWVTDAYKWKFLGGSEWFAKDDGAVVTSSAAYVAPTPSGGANLSFVATRAGIYQARHDAVVTINAAVQGLIGFIFGGGGFNEDQYISPGVGNFGHSAMVDRQAVAAAAAIGILLAVGGGNTITLTNRRLAVQPVRII